MLTAEQYSIGSAAMEGMFFGFFLADPAIINSLDTSPNP